MSGPEDAFAELLGKVSAIWSAVSKHDLGPYQDAEWCEDYDPDHYILEVLSWYHHNTTSQEAVAKRALSTFDEIGKGLNSLDDKEIVRIAAQYPMKWQQNHVVSLALHLSGTDLSMADLNSGLAAQSTTFAIAALKYVLGTDSSKIPECYLRDCLRLEVFPIDTRVSEVLEHFAIPEDSSLLREACRILEIPTRVAARATYDLSEQLTRG